jgi:hypothetical protein
VVIQWECNLWENIRNILGTKMGIAWEYNNIMGIYWEYLNGL